MPSRKPALIDLSHDVEHGMITYKGLPAPIVCDYLSRKASRQYYSDGTSFQIGKIDLVANTGTYVDVPFHRFEGGKDLSEVSLLSLANLDGLVIRVPPSLREIGPQYFQGHELLDKAVLIHTAWDRNWRTDSYFEGHPFLTRAAAEFLLASGARLVGIDSYNIDDVADGQRPVHTILLGAEIPIVEHLCRLEELPDRGFAFTAAPVKVKGMGTFPVRAFGAVGA